MTKLSKGTGFAQLFKKYRLRSEIETLSEFGDLLAEEGMIYETSLFTRWQKGDRIPRERKVVMAILTVFMKQKGIVSIEEANKLIEAANQRDLNFEEVSHLSKYLSKGNNATLPVRPHLFVGRQQLLKNISWAVINKKKVLLYGMPGVGKTYSAIYIAHQLQKLFPDGIYWFRADVKDFQNILDELLQGLGNNPQEFGSIDNKFQKLASLLEERNSLIILDNITQLSHHGLQRLYDLPCTIITTSIEVYSDGRVSPYKVDVFSLKEFFELSEQILGRPYVDVNQEHIERIGKEVGLLPISSVISMKQIYAQPTKLKEYLQQVTNHTFNLKEAAYDNKSLFVAIDLAYHKLDQHVKDLLASCASFDGTDFGLETVSSINGITKKNASDGINQLIHFSLVEYAAKDRFRLHPAIKDYLLHKVSQHHYLHLAQHFIARLKKFKKGSDKYIQYFQKEYENILGSFKKAYKYGNYEQATLLWPLINHYIFISGNWAIMLEYDPLIQESYKKMHDERGLAIYLIEDLGRVYFFQNRKKHLIRLFQQSIQIANREKDLILMGLINQKKAIINMYSNNLVEAEFLLKDTIDVLKNTNYKDQLSKSYAYLGMVYSKLEEHNLAVLYIHKALKNSKILEDISVVAFIYVYLGSAYLKMDKYPQSDRYLNLGLEYAKKHNVMIAQAMAMEGLGILYQKYNNDKNVAQTYTKEARKMYNLLGIGKEKRLI